MQSPWLGSIYAGVPATTDLRVELMLGRTWYLCPRPWWPSRGLRVMTRNHQDSVEAPDGVFTLLLM